MKRRRMLWLVAGLVGTAGLAAGIATASIPDASGVIHACYTKTSSSTQPPGSVRVIDTGIGQTCTAAENSLNWGVRGPTGAQGLQGPQGRHPGSKAAGYPVGIRQARFRSSDRFFLLSLLARGS